MTLVVDKLTLNKLVSTDIKLPSLTPSTIVLTDSKKVATTTGGISDQFLTQISSAGKVANSALTATSSATNNAIVARDGNGDTSAVKITLSSQRCFSALSSGAQTIANLTPTKLTNWTPGTGDWVNDTSVAGEFKITRAGIWSITAHVSWTNNANGVRQNQIRLNDVVVAGTQFAPLTDGVQTLNVSVTAVLSVNDIISVNVYQNRGDTLDVTSSRLDMVLLF